MKRKAVMFLALLTAFALGWFVGGGGGSAQAGAESDETPAEVCRALAPLGKILHYVETNYAEKIERPVLIEGAIQGLLDMLDPHSMFLPPDIYREMKVDSAEEFQGVGIVIERRDESGALTVARVLPDSPAEQAGLRLGDLLLKIDGKPTYDLSLRRAARALRGLAGTRARLLVKHGADQPAEVVVERGPVDLGSVEHRRLGDDIGYVKVRSFQTRTAERVAGALARMAASRPDRPLAGLVLDLRDNPGGLLMEAVKLTDLFLDEGLIVSTEARAGEHIEQEFAGAEPKRVALPLVVLLNGGSASASEIVAGALQDHGRARVVGERSFGKGSVQNIIDLEDGSGLKLTVAHYFTPRHRSFENQGITPDFPVAAAAANPGEDGARPGREDAQLEAALALLVRSGR